MDTYFIFYAENSCRVKYAEITCKSGEYEKALREKRNDVYKILSVTKQKSIAERLAG